ncbi:hypothetical protein [Silvanigrella aquatica]|uniref:HEAT repeat domain-containing protein n=1 Tax=Silvanigrella aquatica TaxID=1915309 RepID=A0A1L4D239_9BACT|nr:hypothetical protein [Silvanigrella aquatica]APJ04275.1 hypothetical protein AXG55_10305 [Silvanigrella aquatica]
MGIFDRFFSSSSKSYDKYGDVLKKLMTTKEQRMEAIEALQGLTAEQSVPQLLKRFEISVDSGIQDTKEKEQCLKLIVNFGDKSKAFIADVLAKQRKISWPIKIAEKIFSHEEYVDILLNNLDSNIEVFDETSLERNEEILLALKDVRGNSEAIVEKVTEFLTSRDDNIRMAALECLEEHALQSVKAKEIILELSKAAMTDENSRFLGVVHSIIQNHKWM